MWQPNTKTYHVSYLSVALRFSSDKRKKSSDKINNIINSSVVEGEMCGNGVKVSNKVSSGESIMLDLDKEGPEWIGTALSSTATWSTGVIPALNSTPGAQRLALLCPPPLAHNGQLPSRNPNPRRLLQLCTQWRLFSSGSHLLTRRGGSENQQLPHRIGNFQSLCHLVFMGES